MTLVLPLAPAMDIALDSCRSRPSLTEPTAPRAAPAAAPLRLPDIRPPPSPSEESMRLICHLQDAADEARERRRRDSSNGGGLGAGRLSDRTRSRQRPAAAGGLEDFLNEAPRRPGRAGRQPRAARPTQRQAIDDETTVPAEVFDAMLRLGQEARTRATHTMAFAQPDGRPYLRHHDASALLAAAQEEAAPAAFAAPLADQACASSAVVDEPEATPPPPVPMLPPRPPSSCASEVASGRSAWDARVEAMAMEVA
mmetsp:Transcript_39605/g.71019  ORF Transcript_39605/g.71019 Transcript_39605/m.71019 type:complete len:254 (+) Transcript_39605:200-961(+)